MRKLLLVAIAAVGVLAVQQATAAVRYAFKKDISVPADLNISIEYVLQDAGTTVYAIEDFGISEGSLDGLLRFSFKIEGYEYDLAQLMVMRQSHRDNTCYFFPCGPADAIRLIIGLGAGGGSLIYNDTNSDFGFGHYNTDGAIPRCRNTGECTFSGYWVEVPIPADVPVEVFLGLGALLACRWRRRGQEPGLASCVADAAPSRRPAECRI